MPSVARTTIVLVVFASICPLLFAQTVLSSTITGQGSQPLEGLAPDWSYSLPMPSVQLPSVTAAALAPNGRCVAVAGVGQVDVLDIKGQKLWTWEYGKVNKFIAAGGLAVSPNCDLIVLVGDSSYKYTWIVSRSGRRAPIRTTSTPMGIAISHDGEHIVLGTGGCDLLFLTKSGALKWRKTYNDGSCIFATLSFSPNDEIILLQGSETGMVTLDGTSVWSGRGWGMAAARDLQSFVSWWSPSHGHATGSVTLFDGNGKELWHKIAPGEAAAISASGDKIVAPVYEKQELTPEEWDNIEEIPVDIQVFSHTGRLLKTLPVEAREVLAMSGDGNRLLVRVPESVEELDGDGKVLLKIPDPQMSYSQVFVPNDFSGALVWRRSMGNAIEWFTLK